MAKSTANNNTESSTENGKSENGTNDFMISGGGMARRGIDFGNCVSFAEIFSVRLTICSTVFSLGLPTRWRSFYRKKKT